VADLPVGARLRLGTTAVVTLVADLGTGLNDSASDAQAAGLLEANSPGLVRAEVVDPGEVTVGDAVELEAVAVPVTDVLDLHSFRPEETQQVVAAYLDEAGRAGLDEVRIVHGRGRGVQRELVRRVLDGTPAVAGFADAPPARGGWGATVVWLRREEASESR
jgi:DNA-nicking Smr family endonuclease